MTGGSRGIGYGVAKVLAACRKHPPRRAYLRRTTGAVVTIDGGFSQRPAQIKEW